MKRAKAIVEAVKNYNNPDIIAEVSKDLGEAMPGIDVKTLKPEDRYEERGW